MARVAKAFGQTSRGFPELGGFPGFPRDIFFKVSRERSGRGVSAGGAACIVSESRACDGLCVENGESPQVLGNPKLRARSLGFPFKILTQKKNHFFFFLNQVFAL